MSDTLEKAFAHGNAAALRAALESIEDDCRILDRKDMWEEEVECYYDALRDIREKVSAALSAPPEPPSNASAMRAALEEIYNEAQNICDYCDEQRIVSHRADKIERIVNTALASPARNADRFDEYHDAVDAWHREVRCLGHHEDGGTCAKDPLASTLAPVCFARWLFDTAEGGAE